LALANQHLAERAAREENLDVLPFTPVSSTCSSGMGDLSSAELQDQQEQQDIKPKKRKLRQAATKQPNPDPLESNQTKQPRTRITRAKSGCFLKIIFSIFQTVHNFYLFIMESQNR